MSGAQPAATIGSTVDVAVNSAFDEGRRGACREYLLNTAEHARALGIHDAYLEELVERVARLREERVPDTAVA